MFEQMYMCVYWYVCCRVCLSVMIGDSHGVYSVVCIGWCVDMYLYVYMYVSVYGCLSVGNASVGLVCRFQVLLL